MNAPVGPRPARIVLLTTLLLGTVLGGTAAGAGQSDSVSLAAENGSVIVHATDEATVHGTADLPEETELSVGIRSAGDTDPQFFKSATATVGPDGTFSATFDLAELSAGDEFTVTVSDGNSTIAESDGRILAPGATVTPGATEGDTVTSLPGFGVPVAVTALLALAGLAGLARRR
ncbi:BGTF surface domain-containing protein [Halorarum halobium]|uniref:BGTF surface domain-containing protein n=1 Tax=Halorarum halobium TaxID=3075121 RepID=UPI0028AADAF7|nr:BGTF surface domain-containing protein [Halobaculum sp. XH14]